MTAKPRSKPAATKSVTKILIVDDHPIVRRGLAQVISDYPEFEVCGEAATSHEALRLAQETKPDVMIIDISLKTGNGLDLIKQIKSRDGDAKMLVSSMHDESLFAERALRAGAMGYVAKHEAADKIIEAVRTVLEGRIYLSPKMTERMLHNVVNGSKSPDESPIHQLSDRELEVFQLIGQGLTTRQIGQRLFLSVKTIETYRENIKMKLNLKTAAELNLHAVKYVLESS